MGEAPTAPILTRSLDIIVSSVIWLLDFQKGHDQKVSKKTFKNVFTDHSKILLESSKK